MELFYLGAYFLAGAVALQYAYASAVDAVLKHQLKWVTRGTWVAIVPFATFYALPYFLGFVPNILDECIGPLPGGAAHHLRLRHRALPADGRGHHLPPRHLLYARHGGNRGPVFWRLAFVADFFAPPSPL